MFAQYKGSFDCNYTCFAKYGLMCTWIGSQWSSSVCASAWFGCKFRRTSSAPVSARMRGRHSEYFDCHNYVKQNILQNPLSIWSLLYSPLMHCCGVSHQLRLLSCWHALLHIHGCSVSPSGYQWWNAKETTFALTCDVRSAGKHWKTSFGDRFTALLCLQPLISLFDSMRSPHSIDPQAAPLTERD